MSHDSHRPEAGPDLSDPGGTPATDGTPSGDVMWSPVPAAAPADPTRPLPQAGPPSPAPAGVGGSRSLDDPPERGVNVVAVVLGVLALLVAAAVLTVELLGLSRPWIAPGITLGAGALLLVVGAVGLVRRSR